MDVTRKMIQDGVVKFLETDVVKVITDKPVMMVTAVLTSLIKNSDKVVDNILDNPIVSALIPESSTGLYNLDALFEAIADTIDRYGNFELKIPLLRKPFIFNADDFKKLKAYIEGGDGNV